MSPQRFGILPSDYKIVSISSQPVSFRDLRSSKFPEIVVLSSNSIVTLLLNPLRAAIVSIRANNND